MASLKGTCLYRRTFGALYMEHVVWETIFEREFNLVTVQCIQTGNNRESKNVQMVLSLKQRQESEREK